ncbi:MAG TPA: alpha/beta fold hydrolase [Acidimicrobiia bacterium]|nr:alpha/beta fold hydrolase [Acidimicrobiia bacterium]
MTASVEPPPQREGPSLLPVGRRIQLGDQGTTFVREVAGPPGAPTLLLLHGWVASAGLNWFQTFEPLRAHFNIVAPDLRGHARGLRTHRIFRLSDCADDCAATIEALDTGPVIAVGYSMGGPVAQLMWRRHRDLVEGLVLCATSAGFAPNRLTRSVYQTTMFGATALARMTVPSRLLPAVPMVRMQPSTMPTWAAAEMRRHDWRMIIEAGHSITTYSARRWIGEVDVPTAILCTTEDHGVAPALQLDLAGAIKNSTVHSLADGHLACANARFAEPLVAACLDVAERIR